MKLYEIYSAYNYFILTEAERTEKENQLFSYFSDEDLDALMHELDESLKTDNLSEEDPRNSNAYSPKGDTLAGGIKARYPERFNAISSTVKTMPAKQQDALKYKVKAEKQKREKSPKPTAKSSPGLLKKAVKSLGALALAGVIGMAALNVDASTAGVGSNTQTPNEFVSSMNYTLGDNDQMSTRMLDIEKNIKVVDSEGKTAGHMVTLKPGDSIDNVKARVTALTNDPNKYEYKELADGTWFVK